MRLVRGIPGQNVQNAWGFTYNQELMCMINWHINVELRVFRAGGIK